MIGNKLLLSFFGISACFVTSSIDCLSYEEIIGGDVAQPNEFPYHVALNRHTGSFCGGGIIGDQFILTAAHCVVKKDGEFNDKSIKVIAGTNDLSNTTNAVNLTVAKLYVPYSYHPETNITNNDIAVLKLEKPLGLSTHANLKKLKLPKNSRNTYNGKTVKITGYGWNWVQVNVNKEETGGKYDTSLQFAEADVLSNAECQSRHTTTVYNSQICARTKQRNLNESSGVCSGDSGGPLVLKGKTVVGVVSTSPKGCTEKVSAAIYTRVSSFLDFIHDAMNDRESDDIRTFELIPSSRSYDKPTKSQSDDLWVWS